MALSPSTQRRDQSTLSKFISKFRPKRSPRRLSTSLRPPQDPRPALLPSPIPLVLPQHQNLLSTLGWTTLTLPNPTTSDTPLPDAHPLQRAYQDLFAAAQTFFDFSVEEKAKWKHRLCSEEGWSHIPGEKEFITLRTLEYTPDVLKAPAKRYWDLMGAHLSTTLSRVAASLDLPEEALTRFIGPCARLGDVEADKTASMLRIFRYEGWDAKVVAEPHADLGLLSCVVGDVPGLEVWSGNGWLDVERSYTRHQATLLAGRQLERFSNYRYRAGGHRVVSYGDSGAEADARRYRHSIVFVLRAHGPVVVESAALETEITGKWNPPVSGVTAGEMYAQIRSQHFNINTGHQEREKQKRNIQEGNISPKQEGREEGKGQATA